MLTTAQGESKIVRQPITSIENREAYEKDFIAHREKLVARYLDDLTYQAMNVAGDDKKRKQYVEEKEKTLEAHKKDAERLNKLKDFIDAWNLARLHFAQRTIYWRPKCKAHITYCERINELAEYCKADKKIFIFSQFLNQSNYYPVPTFNSILERGIEAYETRKTEAREELVKLNVL